MGRFKGRVERAVSAGGVVYRRRGGEVEVVLCGIREPERWRLPKGTPDRGETILQTAVREVEEETGFRVEVEDSLGSVNYWFQAGPGPTRYNKTVHFYLMSHRGGSAEDHDSEFDEVEWVPAEAARERLTFATESEMVDRAMTMIEKRSQEGEAAG